MLASVAVVYLHQLAVAVTTSPMLGVVQWALHTLAGNLEMRHALSRMSLLAVPWLVCCHPELARVLRGRNVVILTSCRVMAL